MGGRGIDRPAWILLVVLGVLGLALILSSPRAAADGTSGIEGGNGQVQVYVTVRSAFDLAESGSRSEEHTSELQSRLHLVCRLLLEKKKHLPQNHSRICYT